MEPIAAVGAAVVVVLGVIVALLLRGRGAHPGPATPLPLADPRDPSLQDEVRRRLATGDKIAAIRLYRERTGAGLREAKDAVDAMARDAASAGGPALPTGAPDPLLLDDIRRHLAAGDKIAAIRLYRERTGADLRDAKRAVEEMAGDGP